MFVVFECALLGGCLACECAATCFSFWVVVYGDFFAVAFVYVYVWGKVFEKISVGGCGDYCFALLACLFLEVVGEDFGGVAVECACEFVEEPELCWCLGEFCDVVAVFLSITELPVAAKKEESVV